MRPALALIALALTLSACTNPMTGAPTSPTATATPTPSPTPTPIPSPTVVNGQIVVSNLDPKSFAKGSGDYNAAILIHPSSSLFFHDMIPLQ